MEILSQNASQRGSILYYVYIDWTLETIPRVFYVGKGKKNRVNLHKRNKRHSHVSAKYGFRREIISSFENEQEAHNTEIRLIAELHTYVYDLQWNGIGCNYTKGGEGSSGLVLSPEQRLVISNRNKVALKNNQNGKGRFKSHKEREHIRQKLLGHNVSNATRQKISMKLIGKKQSKEHTEASRLGRQGLGRAVYQIDLIGTVITTYPSAKLAQDATGISRSHICSCCKNKRKLAGGFQWKYVNPSSTKRTKET